MVSIRDESSQSTVQRTRWTWFRDYCAEDVTESWADSILIISCFLSGLIDSAVFNVWSCFVSMQTGNTVYVGLGFSGQPLNQPYRWAKSLTAILCFSIGTFAFSRCVRLLGQLRRGTMFLSFMIQAALCFTSAALVASSVVPEDAGTRLPENFIVLVPLSMLSFQSAGQIVMSRTLAYNEVPTVVLTSTYCDLMFDPHLFTARFNEDVKRNRRVLSIIMLVIGAIAGGFLTKDGTIAGPLWIAGAVKVMIAFVWMFWKAQGTIMLE